MTISRDNLIAVWVECGILCSGDEALADLLRGASLAEDATPLFDLNGELLMYRIPFWKTGGRAGYLDIGVHEALANPLQKICAGDWNEAQKLVEAGNVAREISEKVDVESGRFVLYNYPRVGIQFEVENAERLLIDASTFAPVPDIEFDAVGEPRSLVQWSMLDNLSPRNRVRNKERREAWMNALANPLRDLKMEGLLDLRERALDQIGDLVPGAKVCSGWLRYGVRRPNHFCFELRVQKTDPWCVPACVQMLLDFYRYEYTQCTLAEDLGLGTLSNPHGLACSRDEFNVIDVIERRSRGALSAEVNGCSDSFWIECMSEVEENRPLIMIGIQHARVVVGYIKIDFGQGFPKLGLAFFDPLGEIEYWESFEPGRYQVLYSAMLSKLPEVDSEKCEDDKSHASNVDSLKGRSRARRMRPRTI
jgi:hypothetical protein